MASPRGLYCVSIRYALSKERLYRNGCWMDSTESRRFLGGAVWKKRGIILFYVGIDSGQSGVAVGDFCGVNKRSNGIV